MKKILNTISLTFILMVSNLSFANPIEHPLNIQDVPKQLQDWVKWAEYGTDKNCFTQNSSEFCYGAEQSYLNIDHEKETATFKTNINVLSDSVNLTLPHIENHWIKIAKSNENNIVITENQQQIPQTILKKGINDITLIYDISKTPEKMTLPQWLNRLKLSYNGVVTNYEQNTNTIFLNPTQKNNTPKIQNQENYTSKEIYHLVDDNHPSTITSWFYFTHSGLQKTILIPKITPKNAIPLTILSTTTPSSLNDNGDLEVELTQGKHVIVTKSVYTTSPTELINISNQQEIWAFNQNNNIRQVQLEGQPQIESNNLNGPAEIIGKPTYILQPNQIITITEKTKGMQNLPNSVSLTQDIWHNIDEKSWQITNKWNGQIQQPSRYEVLPYFSMESASNIVNRVHNPIRISSNDNKDGIEINPQSLVLQSELFTKKSTFHPTGGVWDSDNITSKMHIPPGAKLLHIAGPDKTNGSWFENWTLWGFFVIIIFTVALFKLTNSYMTSFIGVIAAILIQFEATTPLLVLYVATFIAVITKFIDNPKAQKVSAIAVLLLVIQGIWFTFLQIRASIYPELFDNYNSYNGYFNLNTLIAIGNILAVTMIIIAINQFYKYFKKVGEKNNIAIPIVLLVLGFALFNNPMNNYNNQPYYAPEIAQVNQQNMESSINGIYDMALAPSSMKSFENVAKERHNVVENISQTNRDPFQTGLGTPSWQGKIYNLSFTGRQSKDKEIKIYMLNKTQTFVWNMVGIITFWMLIIMITEHILKYNFTNLFKKTISKINLPKSTANSFFVILLGSMLLTNTNNTHANELKENNLYPSQELLTDLKNRMNKKSCSTEKCWTANKMTITQNKDDISISLNIHSEEKQIVQLPLFQSGINKSTLTYTIANIATYEAYPNSILLNKGIYDIQIKGQINSDSVSISYNTKPKYLELQTEKQWTTPTPTLNQWNGNIILTKITPIVEKKIQPSDIKKQYISPQATLTRTINLQKEWSIQYRLELLNTNTNPISYKIPLLKNEKIISSQAFSEGTFAVVNIKPNTTSAEWTTTLPITNTLSIHTTPDLLADNIYVNVDNEWRVQWGKAKLTKNNSNLLSFLPTKNETITLDISQPKTKIGRIANVNNLYLSHTLSDNTDTVNLNISINSSIGQDYLIDIPQKSVVKTLSVNNQTQFVQPIDNQLRINLSPGNNTIAINYYTPIEWEFKKTLSSIKSSFDGVNQTVVADINQNRVVLFIAGEGWHSIVLFVSVILSFLLLSFLLATVSKTNIAGWQWFLVLLGTYPLGLFSIIIVIWLLLMCSDYITKDIIQEYKEKLQKIFISLTVMSFISVIFVLYIGLIDYPNFINIIKPTIPTINFPIPMIVWYNDLFNGQTLNTVIYSIPAWSYKTFMFIWALWMANALSKWITIGYKKFFTQY